MTKRLFYISPCLEDKSYGGSVVAKSNLEAVMSVQGYSTNAFSVNRKASTKHIRVPTTNSRMGTALANLLLLCATLSPKGAYCLLKEIRLQKPEIIWLDSSLFGILVPFINLLSSRSKIICYLHNIEAPIVKNYAKKQPFYWISYVATAVNEFLSIRRSDLLIAIHQTDEKILKSRNPRALTYCLPASISDNFDETAQAQMIKISNIPYALFVGSDFPPNIEALAYLNSIVAPKLVNKKIIAIGNGIDKYANKFTNLDIRGRVENIADYYTEAAVIVAPIFSGGGMKVKVAEALMFNKIVLASSFAAIGYEEVPDCALKRIDDDATFIECIQRSYSYSNINTRQYYLKLFSLQAVKSKVQGAIASVDSRQK